MYRIHLEGCCYNFSCIQTRLFKGVVLFTGNLHPVAHNAISTVAVFEFIFISVNLPRLLEVRHKSLWPKNKAVMVFFVEIQHSIA